MTDRHNGHKPPPPPSDYDEDEPQPQRAYEHLRDYFKLPRFRFDFGAKHNAQEFWKNRGLK